MSAGMQLANRMAERMLLQATNHTHQNQFIGSIEIPRNSSASVPMDVGMMIAKQQHAYPAVTVDLSPVSDLLALEDDDGRINLGFVAPIHTQTGYGHFAAILAKYLARDPDIALHLYPYEGHFGGPDMPEEVMEAAQSTVANSIGELCRIGVLMNFPWRHSALCSPYKIHIGFYETTELSERWVNSTNHGFDEVWVFSTFCRELFSRKLNVPVFQMHGGYDPEEYWYEDRRSGTFKVGIAGRLTGRKSVGELQSAFIKTFDEADDVELHIKTREFHPDVRVEMPDGSTRQGDPEYERTDDKRVCYHFGDWSVRQMREFYQSLDLFVFPSKGEGLGLEPLEAMACGCPTIVTNWSGMADYADPDYCYPIDVDRLESSDGQMLCGGDWAVVDFDAVSERMRYCYENREKSLDLGMKAANAMKTDWTIAHGAEGVKQRLFSIADTL